MFEKELAVGILILTYALMVSEKVHRTVAVLVGAIMMVFLGVINQRDVIHFIQWETLGLIFGMFIIVAALSESGFFRWVGLHALKTAKFNPAYIFVLFSAITGLLAAFMDSITVMIFMAALTIEVCRILKVPVLPFLIVEICSANIGGAATMVGDPPNVIIGTQLGLSFSDFAVNVGVIAIVMFAANLLFLYWWYKKVLVKRAVDMERIYKEHAELEPFSAIRDVTHMRISLAIFAFTVTLLMMHKYLDIMVATVALLGATIVLLTAERKGPDLFDKIDWHTLVFLAGLFVVVGGLESSGIMSDFAGLIVSATGGNAILVVTVLLWTMAPVSAFLDNVPFAAAMVPAIREIATKTGMPLTTLAWTLAVVADVSGNGTPIGASANVVGISVARKNGEHVHWKDYCKSAFPAMLICIAIANVMLVLMFLV